MSLRLIPSSSQSTSLATSIITTAPSVPGLPDPLRSSLSHPSFSTTATTSSHPLEARLRSWAATQESLKMEGLRRTFGIAEPVRRGMEMKIVRAGEWRPSCLGGSARLGLDILSGMDDGLLGWEDIFRGDELTEPESFHTEMERTMGMNW